MKEYQEIIEKIDHQEHKKRYEEILLWMDEKYPQLERQFKWSTPMYADHGTFIIAFKPTKHHIAFTPEYKGIQEFEEELIERNYQYGSMNINIKWDQEVPYDLFKKIIDFNIKDKKDCKTYWRK